ncbi:hypothetical protein [Streptomyces apocyni]|uniref:hypothetical protein n=1 Tax=Streptomyces apocyni TaxID=2654677 RepID=UPI0012E9DFD2|nr:hypothetical protein [Streptomyces apocyni]
MDQVEHVSVHSDTQPYPVLALYTRARSHLAAVAVAVDAWREARAQPEFDGWRVVRVRAIRIGAEAKAEGHGDWAG